MENIGFCHLNSSVNLDQCHEVLPQPTRRVSRKELENRRHVFAYWRLGAKFAFGLYRKPCGTAIPSRNHVSQSRQDRQEKPGALPVLLDDKPTPCGTTAVRRHCRYMHRL